MLVCGEGEMSGITTRRGENQVDFLVFLAAGMAEQEGIKKKKWRRERVGLEAAVTENEEKEERGLQNYQNARPSSFLVLSCSIFDTASIICYPNSKPKIDNTTFHQLFTSKNV